MSEHHKFEILKKKKKSLIYGISITSLVAYAPIKCDTHIFTRNKG